MSNRRNTRRQASPAAAAANQPDQPPRAEEPEINPIAALVQLLQQQAAQQVAQQAAQVEQQQVLLQILRDQRVERERSEGRLIGVLQDQQQSFSQLFSTLRDDRRGSGGEPQQLHSLTAPVPSTSSYLPAQLPSTLRSVPIMTGDESLPPLPIIQTNEVVTLVAPPTQSNSNASNSQNRVTRIDTSSHSSTVKVATFDGTGPWADYQRQFNLIANINGWNSQVKAANLAGSLRGQALTILSTLADDEIQNFEKLSSAINLRFGNGHLTKLFLTQFNTRRQRRDEDLATLGHDVERLSRIALPACDETTRETLAIDRFINSILDSELKHALSVAGPPSLREAIIKALELEALNKQYLGTSRVRQVVIDKPAPEKQKENEQKRSSAGQDHGSTVIKDYKNTSECRYCRKRGHSIDNCFALQKKNRSEDKTSNQTSWRNNNNNYNSNANRNDGPAQGERMLPFNNSQSTDQQKN